MRLRGFESTTDYFLQCEGVIIVDEIRMTTENSTDLKALSDHQKALLQLLAEFDRVCRKLNVPYTLFAGTMLGAVRHQGFIPWDDDLDVLMLRADYERFLSGAEEILDTERFFLQKEYSAHWPMFFSKLRLNRTTCLEKFHPRDNAMHQGVYMDIFPCDNAAPTEIGRRIQFLSSKVLIAKALHARGYDTDSILKKCFMTFCRLLPVKPFRRIVCRKKDGDMLHGFLAAGSAYRKNVYPARWFRACEEMPFEDGRYFVATAYDEILTSLYGDYRRIPHPEERVCKEHAILVDLNRSYEEYEHYRDNMKFEVKTRSIR